MLTSFLEGRDVAGRGRAARDWLGTDGRARVIGLVLFSLALSIIVSVMAAAIVGSVSRRRAAIAGDDAASAAPGDDETPGGDAAGVPVIAVDMTAIEAEAPVGA